MNLEELLAKVEALEARSIQQEAALKKRGGDSVFQDGPYRPNLFVFNGRIAQFSPEQFAVVEMLWKSPDRKMLATDLAKAIYGNEVDEDLIRHFAYKINLVFSAPSIQIPFSMDRAGRYWKLN